MSGPDRRASRARPAGPAARLRAAIHRATAAMTLQVARAGDAALSRGQGPLRRDGRLTRLVPFAIITLASLVLALLPSGAPDAESAHPTAAIVAVVMFAGALVAAFLFPWQRWPPWTQGVVPLAYIATIMLVVHAQGSDGVGYMVLYLLPVAWVALYSPAWQAWLALGMVALLVLLPPWVDQDLLGEDHYAADDYVLAVVVLLIIAFVAGALRVAMNAASRDALTGLPNRRAFMAALRPAPGNRTGDQRQRAVGMLDLDHFKAFNDARGHDAGDRLLAATAHAWSRSLRERDLLARVGGEEFALIIDGDLDAARAVAERLVAMVPEGQTASAGVAPCPPGADPLAALKAADIALYAAKEAGRARVVTADG